MRNSVIKVRASMRSDLLAGRGVGAGATELLLKVGIGAITSSSDGTSQTASSVTMTTAAIAGHGPFVSDCESENSDTGITHSASLF